MWKQIAANVDIGCYEQTYGCIDAPTKCHLNISQKFFGLHAI